MAHRAGWRARRHSEAAADRQVTVLVILFGLPGAGKSFVGEILRAEFGFEFHEADNDIPDDYRQLVLAERRGGPAIADALCRPMVFPVSQLLRKPTPPSAATACAAAPRPPRRPASA